jgi:hypothetical protein
VDNYANRSYIIFNFFQKKRTLELAPIFCLRKKIRTAEDGCEHTKSFALRTSGSQRSLRSLLSSTGKQMFPRPPSYFGALTFFSLEKMSSATIFDTKRRSAEDGCELQSESHCECRRPPRYALHAQPSMGSTRLKCVHLAVARCSTTFFESHRLWHSQLHYT